MLIGVAAIIYSTHLPYGVHRQLQKVDRGQRRQQKLPEQKYRPEKALQMMGQPQHCVLEESCLSTCVIPNLRSAISDFSHAIMARPGYQHAY